MKNALAAVLLCSTTAPLAAQDFLPFGEVYGTVEMSGSYCYICPNEDGTLDRNTAFVLGQSAELTLDTVAEAPISDETGHAPSRGVALSATWTQRSDVEPLWDRYNDDLPRPWWETAAYEWEFELSAAESQFTSGWMGIEIEIELLEWTELTLRVTAYGTTTGDFSASIGGLEATASHSRSGPFGGDQGTLVADGLYRRVVTLPPGQHHLSIVRHHVGDRYLDTREFGSRIQLRFDRGTCPGDLNGDGLLDNGDIIKYVTMFLAGC